MEAQTLQQPQIQYLKAYRNAVVNRDRAKAMELERGYQATYKSSLRELYNKMAYEQTKKNSPVSGVPDFLTPDQEANLQKMPMQQLMKMWIVADKQNKSGFIKQIERAIWKRYKYRIVPTKTSEGRKPTPVTGNELQNMVKQLASKLLKATDVHEKTRYEKALQRLGYYLTNVGGRPKLQSTGD